MAESEIKSVSRVTIKASPNEVYKYISNLKYYLWNPSLRYLSKEEPFKLGVSFDSESVILRKNIIKCHNVVTELVNNESIGMENQLGNIKYKKLFKLKKKDKTTILSAELAILTPSQAFALTTPILKILAQRELKTDLNALKIVVENKLST